MAVLRERASRRGQSLSAYVAGELTKIARRSPHEEVVARLRALDRSQGLSTTVIVDAVRSERH